MRTGSGTFRRMTELAGQHHEPDVDRRAHLLPVRRRGRGQPLLVPARRLRPAPPHRPRRLLRAPRADRRQAHRLPVRRARSGCSTRRPDDARASRHPTCPRIARRRRASSCRPPTTWRGFDVHPAGHSLAVDARGKLFTFALWEGAVRQHGVADGVRYRHGQWLADGATLVAVSDASGEERVEVFEDGDGAHAAVGHRPRARDARRAARHARRDRQPPQRSADRRSRHRRADAWSTAATPAAATTSRGRPTARGSPTRSGPSARHCAIKLHDVADARQSTLVTQPEFRDYCPAFDPDGQVPLLPVDAHVRPGLRQRAVRAVVPARRAAVPDRAAGRAARRRSTRRRRGSKPDERRRRRREGGPARTRRRCAVDLDGIARRVAAFPVRRGPLRPDRRRRRRQGAVDACCRSSARTAAAATRKSPGRLEVFDFATLRAETLLRQGRRASRSPPTARRWSCATASGCARSPRQPQADAAKRRRPATRRRARAAGSTSTRMRVSVEPRSEWRQMLREVWRLQRDQFWVPDMSGVDWDAVYRPLRAAARARGHARRALRPDLGDAGRARHVARLRDGRRLPQAAAGRAGPPGRRPRARGRRRRATRSRASSPATRGTPAPIRRSTRSASRRRSASASSPSTASRCRARVPPQALLVHQAGAKVELTLRAGGGATGDAHGARHARSPTRCPARYREWVERNRALGARAVGRARRLLPPARHDVGRASPSSIATSAPSATATR